MQKNTFFCIKPEDSGVRDCDTMILLTIISTLSVRLFFVVFSWSVNIFYPPEGVDVFEAHVEFHHVEFSRRVIEPSRRYNEHLHGHLLVQKYLLQSSWVVLLTNKQERSKVANSKVIFLEKIFGVRGRRDGGILDI